MEKKYISTIILFFVVITLIISYLLINRIETPPEKYCEHDNDCKPDKCCHAENVINTKFAPNCTGIGCTKDCRTILDCQFGKPFCVDNVCKIKKLKSPLFD